MRRGWQLKDEMPGCREIGMLASGENEYFPPSLPVCGKVTSFLWFASRCHAAVATVAATAWCDGQLLVAGDACIQISRCFWHCCVTSLLVLLHGEVWNVGVHRGSWKRSPRYVHSAIFLNTKSEINNPTTETCSVAFFSGLNFVWMFLNKLLTDNACAVNVCTHWQWLQFRQSSAGSLHCDVVVSSVI